MMKEFLQNYPVNSFLALCTAIIGLIFFFFPESKKMSRSAGRRLFTNWQIYAGMALLFIGLLVGRNSASQNTESQSFESEVAKDIPVTVIVEVTREIPIIKDVPVTVEVTRLPESVTDSASLVESQSVDLSSIISTFDGNSMDSWTSEEMDLTNPGTGGRDGGLENGLLLGEDNSNGVGYFIAPDKFLKNWTLYEKIEFDLWSSGGNYFIDDSKGDLYLENGVSWARLTLQNKPSESFQTFSVSLTDAENWVFGGGASKIDDILINVTKFHIRAEYGEGPDRSGLDNVVLFSKK